MTLPTRKVLALALCLPIAGCCASDGSCGFTSNGPPYKVAIERMKSRCVQHRGIRNWHSTVDNPGAPATFGELEYTCGDGTVGSLGWDSQGKPSDAS